LIVPRLRDVVDDRGNSMVSDVTFTHLLAWCMKWINVMHSCPLFCCVVVVM